MSKIKIFGLGGLNENGKDMYVIDVDNDIFVFDAGLKYDNDINLGIDYIIPNYDYLIKNKNRIKGIFLTHGHESNMGALPDMLADLEGIDIYGAHLTIEILKDDLTDDLIKKVNLHEIKAHNKINFGKNDIFPISVTHSIPDALCYVLYTEDGAIVYSGDFVFDPTMLGKYKTDVGKLAYVGKQGVLCLLSESTYAGRKGYTSPNDRAIESIREVFVKYDKRIIVSLLPAHFYRIQEIMDEISRGHRKLVVMGKKLQTLINRGIDEGYFNFDKSRIGTLDNLDEGNVVVLISDEKQRPFVNLQKIIRGTDKFISIKDDDTIFIAEASYSGIEKRCSDILDEIAMLGLNGVILSNKKVLLHHPSSEDLMLMIDLMNPKYYFPIKGEYRNQYANAEIAERSGMPIENIILKQNGDVCLIENGELKETNEHIDVDQILIDGNGSDDLGDLVLKDREMLSENGIVVVSATVDKDSKVLLGGPEIVTRGFIYVKESHDLLAETQEICKEIIEADIDTNSNRIDYNVIKNDIRKELGNFFYKETESKPMIITVIQEV